MLKTPFTELSTSSLCALDKSLRAGIIKAAETLEKNGPTEASVTAGMVSIPTLKHIEEILKERGVDTNHPSFGPNPFYRGE